MLERSTAQREKMAAIWGKDPLLRGPYSLTITFSSPAFSSLSPFVELAETTRNRAASRSAGASVVGSMNPSVIGTPRVASGERLIPAAPAAAPDQPDANKLIVRFMPKAAGGYTAQMMLSSPLDVRVYEISAVCSSPETRAALEFITPARTPIRQGVPVVNGSENDWSVTASIRGDDFRGPANMKVGAGSTAHYLIEFAPEWVCEREGELTLTNLNTGDRRAIPQPLPHRSPLCLSYPLLSPLRSLSFP